MPEGLHNLQQVKLGYSARNVALYAIDDLQVNGYSEQQGRALFERLREDVSQVPGIESISLGDTIRFQAGSTPTRYTSQVSPMTTNTG